MKFTAIRKSVARQLGWREQVNRKSRACRRALATGGLCLAMGAGASGLTVPDASFEDHNIDAHKLSTGATVDYAYSDDGGGWIDGYSPSAANGESAWTSRESGGAGAWIYNSAYASASNRSTPRTGDQAISGASAYTYQTLTDTFQPNTEYTFSIHAAQPGGTGRFFLYIADGAVVTDGGDDADNLSFAEINFDHSGNPDPTDWVQYSVKHTTGSVGSEIGSPIGISFWSSGNVYFDDVAVDTGPPQRLGLVIDRDTGEVSLMNNTGSAQPIKGYSILSAAGTLDASNWTSIDDLYDASGDGSVDSGEWVEFSDPSSTGDLSEGALATGMIPNGANLSLGVGAWTRYFNESGDITFEYLDGNGNLVTDGSVSFTGTTQTAPYEEGDINFDGDVDELDWAVYVAQLGNTFAEQSAAQAYLVGDFNNDGVNNHTDFRTFKTLFDAANGPGAFAAMIGGVPEPGALVLLACAGVGLIGVRTRRES